MENGRLSVIEDGMTGKLEWCAGNWGLLKIQEVLSTVLYYIARGDTTYLIA